MAASFSYFYVLYADKKATNGSDGVTFDAKILMYDTVTFMPAGRLKKVHFRFV